ncbi:redoxin domain-containing protein [Mucilaginibacter sp. Bleaf8]|uniref:redoxin domain-containing protein n=1 Tax=Mucilaginibacter sp. Bleaf8 TaxID=2834430 RepID=UPI001BD08DF5|nr:redoxin domain-containing protein [Mucilaginibacter sp. Bleaf8]MBS7563272.1 redoxin domain-containing protein [Mucilaginibacter sp. Bleaf8]
MLNQHLNFPAFDALEYTPELEYTDRRYVPLTPLGSGTGVENLHTGVIAAKHPFLHRGSLDGYNLSFRYADRSLVLYFYSPEWGSAGIEHLKQLNNIQHDLAAYQANLLVVHSANDTDALNLILREHNLSFETLKDESHELSKLLGIYSEHSPAWNTYAGIENNIPLPALYAFNDQSKIVFDYPNAGIELNLPLACLESTLLQQTGFFVQRKSA